MKIKIINTVLIYLIGYTLVFGALLRIFYFSGGTFDDLGHSFVFGFTVIVGFFGYSFLFLCALDTLEIFE